MVTAVELPASDFPAAVDTTPISRTRFPARRYSFDGDGNLTIRQYKVSLHRDLDTNTQANVDSPANATGLGPSLSPQPGAIPTAAANIPPSSEALADAIATSLRQTSIPSAAVEPMARTLAALAGDLTTFDKAADAQLKGIEMPSAAARSLLLEAIRSLARFHNLNHSPVINEGDGNERAIRLPPVQVRPFSSASGSGNTTWQVLVQEEPIIHPPNMQCSTGHLFIHRNPQTRVQKCWMYTKDGRWEVVDEDANHPLYPDRVLHFRQNEEPSWWTRASKMTTKARVTRATPGPSN